MSLVASIQAKKASNTSKNGVKYASRKNGDECLVTTDDAEMFPEQDLEEDLEGEAHIWKQRYDQMAELFLAAQKDFEEYKAANAEKEKASLKYLRAMEKKLEGMSNNSKVNTVEAPDQDLEPLKAKIHFYELLTGAKLDVKDDITATCTVRNTQKKLITRFDIIADPNSEDIQFEPTGNVHLLPEFMQTNLSFDAQYAPVVLSHVVNGLYEDS